MDRGKGNVKAFVAALQRPGALLLDGGLATELEASGHDIGSGLWSAALLQSEPQAIVDVHRAYLDAGAQCIISASYQASRAGFMALGMPAAAADELIASSVSLADRARREFLADNPATDALPLIAASVGPFGATRHDGSEYTGKYGIGKDSLRRFHAERLAVLDNAGADVLACETIPDIDEAKVLCELLCDVQTPAWVCFSCRDARCISDGTPVEQAVAVFDDHPLVFAVGINCTAPRFVLELVKRIRTAVPGKAIVVYPNSGEQYDPQTPNWSGNAEPSDFALSAASWHRAGAKLIGGCCRIGPRHITEIGAQLAGVTSADN